MPKFKYVAIDLRRARRSGGPATPSARCAARRRCSVDQQLDVQQLTENEELHCRSRSRTKKLKQADLMHFSPPDRRVPARRDPAPRGARRCSTRTDDKTLRHVLIMTESEELCSSGDTFSDALTATATMFPQLLHRHPASAELTGSLDTVLDQLSTLHRARPRGARARSSPRSPTRSSSSFMSIVTVVVLAVLRAAEVQDLLRGFDAELPLPTRMLISVIADFFGHWWFVIARRARGDRDACSWRCREPSADARSTPRRAPAAAARDRRGRSATRSSSASAGSSSAMMRAGVPLPEAMAVLATEATQQRRATPKGWPSVRDAMLRGEGLARPIADTGCSRPRSCRCSASARRPARSTSSSRSAADYYEQELDYKLKRLTTLFEPAVIMFMGLIVGFVAIALVSAMYGIYRPGAGLMPRAYRDRSNVPAAVAAGLGGGDALRNDLVITNGNEAYHDASKGGTHAQVHRARA